MAKYIVDFEAWTTIEADSQEEAYAIAQGIINQLDEVVSGHLTLAEPLEIVVAENGIEEV